MMVRVLADLIWAYDPYQECGLVKLKLGREESSLVQAVADSGEAMWDRRPTRVFEARAGDASLLSTHLTSNCRPSCSSSPRG